MIILEHICEDGHVHFIKIGRNAIENDNLVKTSHQNDFWFHLNNVPSCHITSNILQKCINNTFLNKINTLLFEYTPKAPKSAKMIYAQITNVKRTNIPGQVVVLKNIKW